MALQRLDIKSARYDRLARSVLIDGRACVIEISHEAMEALSRRRLKPDEAVGRAVSEAKLLTTLASRLPADDGKIHITANILVNDGRFAPEKGS